MCVVRIPCAQQWVAIQQSSIGIYVYIYPVSCENKTKRRQLTEIEICLIVFFLLIFLYNETLQRLRDYNANFYSIRKFNIYEKLVNVCILSIKEKYGGGKIIKFFFLSKKKKLRLAGQRWSAHTTQKSGYFFLYEKKKYDVSRINKQRNLAIALSSNAFKPKKLEKVHFPFKTLTVENTRS